MAFVLILGLRRIIHGLACHDKAGALRLQCSLIKICLVLSLRTLFLCVQDYVELVTTILVGHPIVTPLLSVSGELTVKLYNTLSHVNCEPHFSFKHLLSSPHS